MSSDKANNLLEVGDLLGQGFFADSVILAIARHRRSKPITASGLAALKRLSTRCSQLVAATPEEVFRTPTPRGVSYASDVEQVVRIVAHSPTLRPNDASWEFVRHVLRRLADTAKAVANSLTVDAADLELVEEFARAIARDTLEGSSELSSRSDVPDFPAQLLAMP